MVADFVEALCRQQGWTPGFTNEKDPNTTLSERVANAHAFHSDILVSIHHDWTGGRQAVIYPNNHDISASIRLAKAISTRIDPLASTTSIVYADTRNLTVLRTTHIPAVIVECARVQDPYTALKMAEAIVRGMAEYYKVKYIEPVQPKPPVPVTPPAPEPTYRVVTIETKSKVHRDAIIAMLKANNSAHAVLGRSIAFHDAIADVKEIEAYVAKFPSEIKRTHGVVVAAGTHTPLNTPLPFGKFTDEEAFDC
jgi:hypothetical protein